MKKNYAVLTYNIGGYELMKEIKEKSPNANYYYVTDDRTLTSSTWEMIYVDNPHPEDNFDLCYDIRFNPFKYVKEDIVIRIDGSMKVIGNTDELIDMFNAGNYDISLCIHPGRNTMFEEYKTWCACRGYKPEQANRCLSYMANMEGYDVVNYKGLYQYNFMIQRKNKVNLDLNRMTLAVLKYLAEDGKQIERIDQTIGSFILNKYFAGNINVMAVDQRIAFSKYFEWYAHHSNMKFGKAGNLIQPYLFNQPIEVTEIEEV
ncbi:MAG: hypothetical protein IJH39_04095 [Clostridia bacterium]|nr:hypothetical protein [Clostridia bacterium]